VRIAEDAVIKLEGHKANRIAQTTSVGLGNASIIAIGRQFINGNVNLTDIPSTPSLSEQSCSGHLAILHHLIKCVGGHADVGGSSLTADELRRPLPGFGFPTILGQFEHTIGAEVYWQTVVMRGYTEEATLPKLPDVAAIEAFRQQTASATRSYLDRASEAELNSPRVMISDPGQTRLLRPADVIMRVVTHIFNHQGQVLAMCRTIGKPNDTQRAARRSSVSSDAAPRSISKPKRFRFSCRSSMR